MLVEAQAVEELQDQEDRNFVLYWNIPNEIKAKQRDEIVAGRKAKVINLEKQDYGVGNDLLI